MNFKFCIYIIFLIIINNHNVEINVLKFIFVKLGFGQFTTKRYIIFQIENGIDMNILAIIPSIILGVLGGLLGSLFISLNLQIAKIRRRFQAKITNTRYILYYRRAFQKQLYLFYFMYFPRKEVYLM